MKRILSFLITMVILNLNGFTIISCQKQVESKVMKPDNYQKTIHDQIKETLKKPLQFNDEWIIDYHQETKKVEQFVDSLAKKGWTYLSKTIAYLIRQRLETEIVDLSVKYPDFTLSVSIVSDDIPLLIDKILNNTTVNFHYDLYYNLQAIQDIEFSYLNDYQKNRGKLVLFNGEFAQYSLLYKDGNKNSISFKQKNYIIDNQIRLDYLTKIIDATSTIKIYDQYYRKFVFMTAESEYIASVIFDSNDFKNKNLVKLIHDDQSYFLKVKDLIIKNLKTNIISKQFINIKDLFENTLGIIDDIELNIELDKAYLTSEIQADEKLNNIYGSDVTAFSHDMLLLKLKTTLKNNGVASTKSIDEIIALDIEYE